MAVKYPAIPLLVTPMVEGGPFYGPSWNGQKPPDEWSANEMPSKEVMPKFKRGELHSGSKTGPKVKNRKQAIAIMLSEKRAEKKGKLK